MVKDGQAVDASQRVLSVAQIPPQAIDTIHKYLVALKRHNIPIQQAVLFGRHVNGDYDEWSDVDLALVSEVFEGIRIGDRSKIRPITLSMSSELEVMPYRPSDFTPEDPFVKEILETGVRMV